MVIQILILIFGFILLISGANTLVNGTSGIAKKFNIPEILIGLTIVALGTSLPELVVTIVSATTNSTNIILGNVIGSNICNLLLILGIVTIIKPLKLEKDSIKINLPLLTIITILVIFMGLGIFSNTSLVLNKTHGIILLVVALIYFLYPIIEYIQNKKHNDNQESIDNINTKEINIIRCIISIIFGIVALKYGGDFVVDSATNIANIFNIPERIISLTIVALGTSLPELVTSVIAIIKHDDDIAEGNIIGSCIINFCLILGVGAFITDLSLTTAYMEDLFLLLASCIIIWLYGFGNKNNTLTRKDGLVLFAIYLIYSIRLFI